MGGSHGAEAGRLYHDVDHGALLGGLEEGQEPFHAGVVSIHPDHFKPGWSQGDPADTSASLPDQRPQVAPAVVATHHRGKDGGEWRDANSCRGVVRGCNLAENWVFRVATDDVEHLLEVN